jgi:DNA-binding transcriptional regulator YiaG
MLEPTKKHPTETVVIQFIGPAKKRRQAIQALKDIGFVVNEEARPWREAAGISDGELPGVCLAGARRREGLTQRQLAEKTGIPQRHISEMENGKRTIGKDRAKVLAEALNEDYRIFL